MEKSIERLLTAIGSERTSLRRYRQRYDSDVAFDFDPIGKFWGLYETASSAILGYFLDPTQAHAQKDVFLRQFLDMLDSLNHSDDLPKLGQPRRVACEDWTQVHDGRMDLVLEFDEPRFCIVLENKIRFGTQDRPNQLEKYRSHLENRFKTNFLIIYLTPDGRMPPDFSLPSIREAPAPTWLVKISWREHMLRLLDQWIGACQAERVRFFLKDFKHAIQVYLGGGFIMDEQEMVVEQIMKSPEALESAMAIQQLWPTAVSRILGKFKGDMEKLTTSRGFTLFVSDNIGELDSSYSFRRKDWPNFEIAITFNNNNYREADVGILYQNGGANLDPKVRSAGLRIHTALSERGFPLLGEPPNDWCPVFFSIEHGFKDWLELPVLTGIVRGNDSTLYKYLWEKIDELSRLIDEAEKALI